ncbi:Transposable element P transposase [Oopsacas minuta]|uniref:Transposable element P transposase n=1 Tax=Oopsacas minuta TaxID=111878 RepID=A0AAV7KAP8_9METZ|nr:Transposable element P transposase [Oopsacas minuta]
MNTRTIKATLMKGAIPKYLPGCPDRLNDLTIKYPRLDRDKKERDLQIQDLRLLFKLNQFSVAKLSPKLNYKSCWSSVLDKQNVELTLRVFDYTNVAAFTLHQSKDYIQSNQTGDFIALICQVWKLINVNIPWKGVRLNDRDSLPLVRNDPKFNVTSIIVHWLDNWKSLPFTRGKLTAQTFASFAIQALLYQNL